MNPLSGRSNPPRRGPRPLALPVILLALLSIAAAAMAALGPEPAEEAAAGSTPVATGAVWGLERFLAYAADHSPELHGQDAEMKAAHQRFRQAWCQRRPALALEGGYDWNRYPQRLTAARFNGEAGTFDDDLYRADLVVKVPLDTNRRLGYEIEASRWRERSAAGTADRIRQELILGIATTFYRVLGQKALIGALESSRQAMQGHLDRVRLLLEGQKAARVDLLRSEVRLAEIERQLVRERGELEVLRQALAARCGWDHTRPFPDVGGEFALVPFEAAVDDGVAKALANRPDYRAMLAAVQSQERTVQATRASGQPALSLHGSIGRRWAPSPIGGAGQGETRVDVGQIRLQATVPFLGETDRIRAKIAEEQARTEVLRHRLASLEQAIRLDVTSAHARALAARQQVEVAVKAVAHAEESLRIEQEKYAQGRGTIVDVLDAQAAHLTAQTGRVQALVDLHSALAFWKAALGEDTR